MTAVEVLATVRHKGVICTPRGARRRGDTLESARTPAIRAALQECQAVLPDRIRTC